MRPLAEILAQLPERGLPARHASEYVEYAQHEAFFYLAAAKRARLTQLKARWAGRRPERVWISANLAGMACELPGVDVAMLEPGYFCDASAESIARKRSELAGSVVIVNNNDVGLQEAQLGYGEIVRHCEDTVFIAWDWDNHHWLELSTFLAAHSDLYAPAHHENLFLLSRFNWLTCGPVYCASVQWPRRWLEQALPTLLNARRNPAPLGMHIPYMPFRFRMQVVTTLNQFYPSVGFSDRNFHGRTPEDRLHEWCAHKLHWIVPVLNDVPIRIFDALITGGIPVIPESLRFVAPVDRLPRQHVLFYGPQDIIDPRDLVARGNALFDAGGEAGIRERHELGLGQHHGDLRVQQMLGYVEELLGGGVA